MIYEENKTKYILGAIIFFLVLIGGVVVFQQIMISNLKKSQIGEKAVASKSEVINSPFTVQAVQKNLADNIKEIQGVIVSKSDNLLTVEADVIDFSKLSKLTEDELHKSVASFPKTKKKYEVLISDKTQLAPLTLQELSSGKAIMVESNEPVYKSDRINASKITVIEQGDVPPVGTSLEDQIKQSKIVTGQIKEIGNKYLIVGANLIDLSKVKDSKEIETGTAPMIAKDYKVSFNDKTQFTDKRPNELRLGQLVRAFSSASVYSINEFAATKIEGPYDDPRHPSFSGQVISKENNVLTVKASDEYGGKTYTVEITDQTTIAKFDYTGVSPNDLPKKTEMNFSDIRDNDQVRIVSASDIQRGTEIEAFNVGIVIGL